ncbi:hypothetical protein MLD38_026448 [Melastoma candidum]|uniref:Uncharacterized protein n=1 Tax=Melastoma candidum TaxID=119954 RepID=A0ACB9P1V9_9MYRT|nr:hypothetical protein MLD38_026448 [Melastoma candidum]
MLPSPGEGDRVLAPVVKDIDVATLGTLCVDIVLDVEELPPPSLEGRKVYMEKLSASPPDKRYWEAGGNCNTAIAAARLGLHCSAIGHVGGEIYGQFLLDVLRDEGIGIVGMSDDVAVDDSSDLYETHLCWVLVDPLRRHGFCSHADFRKEPTFSRMTHLSSEVKLTIKRSKTIILSGYVFNELSPSLLVSALKYAVEVGSSIFFDPGPCGKSLARGTPEERRTLSMFLQMSDVLLLTEDEAESLTGIGNPIIAGLEFLKKGLRIKWVVIKMGARGSVIISRSSISCAPAFKVNVVDTVGCGDSFVAAVAFGYIHRLSFVNTLALANAVGAATALGCGAGRNVATLDKVIELIKRAELNEDVIGNLLDNTELHCSEVTFLSSMLINGTSSKVNRISLQTSVSELLPMLESARSRSSVIS